MSLPKNTAVRRLPDHAPDCLCQRLFGLTLGPFRGELRYSQARGQFIVVCPSCHWRSSAFGNWQAAIADWCGANRPGDVHIERLWLEQYQAQGAALK
jgi:hypothetical protein